MCVVLGVGVISVFNTVAFLACAHRVSSAALSMGSQLGCQGTCHSTCSLVGAGGSNGLLVASGLYVALGNAIDLVVHSFLLSFLVHDEDACLPLGIGSGNIYPGVGDERGVGAWDS